MARVCRSPWLQDGGELPSTGQEEGYSCVHWYHGTTEPQDLPQKIRPGLSLLLYELMNEQKYVLECVTVPAPAPWVMKFLLTPRPKDNVLMSHVIINCHIYISAEESGLLPSTLYWQLGAVCSWRTTHEVLSGRLVWSIPEISVTDGTLAERSHQVMISSQVNMICETVNSMETFWILTGRWLKCPLETMLLSFCTHWAIYLQTDNQWLLLYISIITFDCVSKAKLTFMYFAMACNIHSESLVDLST